LVTGLVSAFRSWKRKRAQVASIKTKADRRLKTAFLTWLPHVGVVFSFVVLVIFYHRYSLPSRSGVVLFLSIFAPVGYVLGHALSNAKTATQISGALSCLCVIPIVFAIVVYSTMADDTTLSSISIVAATTIPIAATIWVVLGLLERNIGNAVRDVAFAISGSTASCCCLVMIPFGVVLPSILSLDWQHDKAYAALFAAAISVLAMVILIFVSILTIAVNSTFSGLQKERKAKMAVQHLRKKLKDVKISSDAEVSRMLYDLVESGAFQK
jgi:hypothetical protein